MQKSISNIVSSTIQLLLEQGDFLSLSRQQPSLFFSNIDFVVSGHTKVQILGAGMIIFEPSKPNLQPDKDIVLSCGIHGNETAPIEICDTLVKQILCNQIVVCQRVLFLFGNLPAMDIAQRFVEENMNRLFSGEHQNLADGQSDSAERRRAKELEEVVEDFFLSTPQEQGRTRFHYDLHTAIRASKNDKFAVYPYRQNQPWDKFQLQILLACGVNTILLSGNPTTTFSYYSSNKFGANAFTVELGKVKPFGQNDMTHFSQVIETLTALICNRELMLKEYADEDFLIYKVNQVINKKSPEFTLNFAEDAPNFTDFPKDHVLAYESDCEYRTAIAGEAIVFPNAQVEIGQRALLTVIPTKIA